MTSKEAHFSFHCLKFLKFLHLIRWDLPLELFKDISVFSSTVQEIYVLHLTAHFLYSVETGYVP